MEIERDMNRAARRHHTARLKRNRRFYHGRDLALNPAHLGMTVATAAPCSCASCGNRRKHFGERTVQEQRAVQELQAHQAGGIA